MSDIVINGFRCRYEYHPVTGAPCVVFLNGIMSSLESWQPQAELAKALGYGVLQYEYRGQWRSEMTPGPYTMQTHADDLLALLKALDIKQPHLAGTSYGGMTAMKFAVTYPDAVASLFLLATTAQIRPISWGIVSNWRRQAATNNVTDLFLTMLPELYSEQYLKSQQELISQRLAGLSRALEGTPHFCAGQAVLNAAQHPDLTDGSMLAALAAVQCPTLVVAAENDRLYPPCDSASIAAKIPQAQMLTIAGAGHAVLMENPQAVNVALAGHLAVNAPINR